jgi:hypothetical protein
MPYTNKFNLPETICNAIMYESKYEDGKYSVTNLIKPPQIYQLEKRYQNQIERDVSDGLWMLLGSSVHYILEKAKPENALKEERLEVKMGDIRIVGKPDLYTANETIEDYKITSVWSFLLGEKPEWTAQLNLYAYLYEQYGFPVKKAKIHAILRDWSNARLLQDENYPPCPFITSEIKVWNKEEQFNYLDSRIYIHDISERKSDEELLECLPEEKWSKSTTWAVKKKGNKRASRVFESEQEMGQYINLKGETIPLEIEERPGEDVRCERFCYAKPFCQQYKREHPI